MNTWFPGHFFDKLGLERPLAQKEQLSSSKGKSDGGYWVYRGLFEHPGTHCEGSALEHPSLGTSYLGTYQVVRQESSSFL